MTIKCPFCRALHWRALSHSTEEGSKFGMCCYQGKISLPAVHNAPHDLLSLLSCNHPDSSNFHQLILYYNNALAMTSVGKTTDHTVNQGGHSPYFYVLHGKLIHQAGVRCVPGPCSDWTRSIVGSKPHIAFYIFIASIYNSERIPFFPTFTAILLSFFISFTYTLRLFGQRQSALVTFMWKQYAFEFTP